MTSVVTTPPPAALTAGALPAGVAGRQPTDRPLEHQPTKILFLRYQRHGDMSAREELTRRFLPLARRLAHRYARASEPLDDLVQVASLGLVKAIDRFEPERGLEFPSYAVPTILGELKRHFRDSGWALHVPRGLQERVLKLNQAVEELSAELGRSPTPGQLADRIGISTEQVLEAIEAAAAHDTASLDAPLPGGDGEARTFADSLGLPDERLDAIEHRDTLARGLRALPERERSIVYLRFADGLTQTEIAERMGVSQMHVSRLIRRSLERLRTISTTELRSFG